ncbi:sulfite exporter TauE/SafE family protein [Colwellia psychrerythraea]|uniref:Probable membrane transporter protein n=1 Tax=Colwellia psychrerythraea (strain 34H / ATCC BAA-681) TaxID=167879 RepID=Q47XF2_COLP3|nr:sulfite exporter TauE/SafE family protein [Colwellia psychrerythraea]AAZ24988.1 putative membrane protein [Colwellia psychrerythraea 34H]
MLIEPSLLVVALIAVIAGSALQSMSGFGLAVIASPILVIINPEFLPAPILALGCILSLLNCIRYRQQLHFSNIKLALLARIPGSVLGIVLLALLPSIFFSVGFSFLIILSVFLTYRRVDIHHCPRNLVLAGFFSGLMGTTTSVGGPPIALVYQNSNLNTLRAELGLFFLIGTLVSLAMLLVSGNINYAQLQLTLPLIPALFVGFASSFYLDKYLGQRYLKPLIATLSLTSCGIILLKAFLY